MSSLQRERVLHLIVQSAQHCGFSRTLVVCDDPAVASACRLRGLAFSGCRWVDVDEAVERHGAIIAIDPPDSDPDLIASLQRRAETWLLLATTAPDLDRAGMSPARAAASREGEWIEYPFGPLSLDDASPLSLWQRSAGESIDRASAAFTSWAGELVRPNDRVVVAGVPVPALTYLRAHTEASSVTALGDHGAGSIHTLVLGEVQALQSGTDLPSRVLPGGRVLIHVRDDSASAAFALLGGRFLLDEDRASTVQGSRFLSAMRTPLDAGEVPPYVESVFPATQPVPDIVAYDRHYLNPWLVHAMIIGRFRLRNPDSLTALAEQVLGTMPKDSADYGGALCVLAYQRLQGSPDGVPGLTERIRHYLKHETSNPHVWRWQISLTFVLAKLDLADGRLHEAEAAFAACAAMDFLRFAPHLGTKCVEAAFLSGWLAWQRGDVDAAERCWRCGLESYERASRTSLDTVLIDPTCPSSFDAGDGLREMTIIADQAFRCANGLRAVAHRRQRGQARPDVIDRNLQNTIADLEGFVHRSNLVVDERLDVIKERDKQFATQSAGRDRTIAGYALLALAHRDAIARGSRESHEARLAAQLRQRRTTPTLPLSSMNRILVFGTGRAGQFAAETLGRHHQIVGFLDNDVRKQGATLAGLPIHGPAALSTLRYDGVLVATVHALDIVDQLAGLGVPASRVLLMHEELDRLVVFGAGAAGAQVLASVPQRSMVMRFADNSPEKQGTIVDGIPVIAPAELKELDYRYVVVASLHGDAIERQLGTLGVSTARVLRVQPSAPVAFVGAPADRAVPADARAFYEFSAEEFGRVMSFGRHADSAALLDFEPSTVAIGVALAAAGCRVTAFGAPPFAADCVAGALHATAAPFAVADAGQFGLLVGGSAGFSEPLVGALRPSHRLIGKKRDGVAGHVETDQLCFWYAPPRAWVSPSSLEL